MSRPNPSPSSTRRHDPYAAFRVPNYRLYIIGWFISMVGTRIQSVAIGWEMYQRTGDALALGLVGLMQALPTMLLAIPAGYLADRYFRPRVVMFSLSLMTMTSLALAALSYTEGAVSLMYAFLLLDATAVILGRPARTALMPGLVSPTVFPNAVMWNTSLSQFSAMIGPAIGGFVVAYSVPSAYLMTAGSSVLCLLMISRLQFAPEDESKASTAMTVRTLLAGIQYVWNKKIILTMISLDMFSVLLGGAVYLLPIYAEDILMAGATGFGWLRAAPAVGAAITALLMVYLPPMRRAGRTLLLTIAAFGVATIVFGVSKSFWLSFFMLLLTGAFDNVSMVIRHTLVQLLTPDKMRGRVSAVNSIFVGASNELGGLESGLVAHWFGPIFSVVSGGIGTIVVVAVTALASPELRKYGALQGDEESETDAEAHDKETSPDNAAAEQNIDKRTAEAPADKHGGSARQTILPASKAADD